MDRDGRFAQANANKSRQPPCSLMQSAIEPHTDPIPAGTLKCPTPVTSLLGRVSMTDPLPLLHAIRSSYVMDRLLPREQYEEAGPCVIFDEAV